jgi:hypothetical protein
MGRNRYLGAWSEPLSNRIDVAFTVVHAREILAQALVEDSEFSHQDIAHWCERFLTYHQDGQALPEIKGILPVLAEVEAQWHLFLVNTYSMEELKCLNFSRVKLPVEWFEQWIKAIDATKPGKHT